MGRCTPEHSDIRLSSKLRCLYLKVAEDKRDSSELTSTSEKGQKIPSFDVFVDNLDVQNDTVKTLFGLLVKVSTLNSMKRTLENAETSLDNVRRELRPDIEQDPPHHHQRPTRTPAELSFSQGSASTTRTTNAPPSLPTATSRPGVTTTSLDAELDLTGDVDGMDDEFLNQRFTNVLRAADDLINAQRNSGGSSSRYIAPLHRASMWLSPPHQQRLRRRNVRLDEGTTRDWRTRSTRRNGAAETERNSIPFPSIFSRRRTTESNGESNGRRIRSDSETTPSMSASLEPTNDNNDEGNYRLLEFMEFSRGRRESSRRVEEEAAAVDENDVELDNLDVQLDPSQQPGIFFEDVLGSSSSTAALEPFGEDRAWSELDTDISREARSPQSHRSTDPRPASTPASTFASATFRPRFHAREWTTQEAPPEPDSGEHAPAARSIRGLRRSRITAES